MGLLCLCSCSKTELEEIKEFETTEQMTSVDTKKAPEKEGVNFGNSTVLITP